MTPTTRPILLCVVMASLFALGCRPPNDNSDRGRPGWKVSTSSKSNAKSAPVQVTPAPPPPKPAPPPPPPAPPAAPAPVSGDRIREVVRSELPYSSIAKADEDAIEQAQKKLVEKLPSLGVRQKPPLSAVREQYVNKESRVVRKPTDAEQAIIDKAGMTDPNLVYVEYTVEMSEPQIRQLRMFDRIVDALRVAAGVFVVALAGFLFLRADDYSRGYLTSWLGLLAGLGVIAGLVAVLTMG